MTEKRKLIEVALPLEDINREASREKAIRHGHPSTLHLWWARRPLAVCRAVLFSSLVDDPSEYVAELKADAGKVRRAEAKLAQSRKVWKERKLLRERAIAAGMTDVPDVGPEPVLEEILEEEERGRLFNIIRDLVKWDNADNDRVLLKARQEIARSIARARGEPAPDKPGDLFTYLAKCAPPVYDPFCGGGSIPLEAQRLGLEAHASDLNPVPVLITKALVEIPPKFANKAPVNPESRSKFGNTGTWKGAAGLAKDLRYYGGWMRNQAERRIGHLYPRATLPKTLGGGEATIVAWLWARTVKCPNPACRAEAPLVKSFWVSRKKGKEVFLVPRLDRQRLQVRFEIGSNEEPPKPTADRTGGRCLFCETQISKPQLRALASEYGLGAIPLALVVEGPTGRVFLPGHPVIVPQVNRPKLEFLEQPITNDRRWFSPPLYGMLNFSDLFTNRQLIALSTLRGLVSEARALALRDAEGAGCFPSNPDSLGSGGNGCTAYAEAIATYLAFAIDKMTDTNTTLCTWQVDPPRLRATFGRQALPMSWDFAEANIFADAAGDYQRCIGSVCEVLDRLVIGRLGSVIQADSSSGLKKVGHPLISTDPPYYDNIGYADLSDFFYVWLRGTLGPLYPNLFTTMLVPKTKELIASAFRFEGDKAKAQKFFETGLGQAFALMRENGASAYPVSIYYAFKQSETDSANEEEENSNLPATASTGWETMLEALLRAGFSVHGTWPMRSEWATRNVGRDTNALASSIVLVCRPRRAGAHAVSRRDFITRLKSELPGALRHLQNGNIAPVDLAQAAIGPGMAVFSRYARVLETDGSRMGVRTALALINQTLDEVLAEQEGEFDADTRWALAWFEQYGFAEGPYGQAETLSTAKNTSVSGLVEAGFLAAKAGKVRLLKKEELADDWDPTTDKRLTMWEVTHHLIRRLDQGESAAAELIQKLGPVAEIARDLSYRLYAICERRNWAQEAIGYNSLVLAWPDLARLTREQKDTGPAQEELAL